ncbi:hypothetical protein CDL12_00466 [Handroanthus impetiginosus]|uniref:FLZ-type domain-containing protein n=1 Tax=Handroanthus impetiginosus TaxID=429701 RepID=A0A2G9IAH5_9LAMI|nr:hypothetical protein CDL12_00466 [Handroanthus impetiginosus]
MMLGKRGRAPFRRTTSMTVMTAVDIGNMAASPPPPRAQKAVIGGEFNIYDPMLSRRNCNHIETADFLRSCGLCNRLLSPGRDIYMYRGDTAFCSLECREQQMKQDERKERRAATSAKHGDSHRRFELAAAATETSGKTESLTAA